MEIPKQATPGRESFKRRIGLRLCASVHKRSEAQVRLLLRRSQPYKRSHVMDEEDVLASACKRILRWTSLAEGR